MLIHMFLKMKLKVLWLLAILICSIILVKMSLKKLDKILRPDLYVKEDWQASQIITSDIQKVISKNMISKYTKIILFSSDFWQWNCIWFANFTLVDAIFHLGRNQNLFRLYQDLQLLFDS